MIAVLTFALTLIMWPGFIESSNTPRWILLSATIPFFLLIAEIKLTKAHLIGFAWLAWAGLTALWSVSLYDSIFHLWHFVILAMVFCVGANLSRREIKWCFLAFVVGVSINAIIALGQMQGWDGVIQAGTQQGAPTGSFMNKNYLAEAALMALPATIILAKAWPIPFIIAALLATFSRGAFAAGGLLLTSWMWGRYRKTAIVLTSGILVAVILYFGNLSHDGRFMNTSAGARISFWANSVAMVVDRPWGQGVGAYMPAYPKYHDAIIPTTTSAYRINMRPRTAHNDFLTIAAETGIPGAFLLTWFFITVLRSSRATDEQKTAFYTILAFLLLGMFNFPLYLPTSAFLATLSAGYLAGGRASVCGGQHRGRAQIRERHKRH